MNSITSCAPFQFEGCGPMFRLSNGLQVDRAGGETQETYKVHHETSLRNSFHSPLFHCSTCNSPTEARSTCDNIVDCAPSCPRLSVPTPTPNGPDFNDNTAPPQRQAAALVANAHMAADDKHRCHLLSTRDSVSNPTLIP